MKNKFNVISIVIDSVTFEAVGTNLCKVSPTPFMDTLSKESITASKLYSDGPYTDAGTKALFSGRKGLNDFGYFFKYNLSPTNHYQVFKDNGYETYGFYYPYYINSDNVVSKIDHTYYTSGFVFTSEWGGIFKYYSELTKERPLTDTEYLLLRRRTELMFQAWSTFYDSVLKNPETAEIIKQSLESCDVNEMIELLSTEKQLFEKEKNRYIDGILEKGLEHPLASIDKIDVDACIDRDFLNEQVYKKHEEVFTQIDKATNTVNKKHNRPSIKRLFYATKRYLKFKNKEDLHFINNYKYCNNSTRKVIQSSQEPKWMYEPSAYRHFSQAIKVLTDRNSEKPFYMSIHIEEPHQCNTFFTYDMQDGQLIDEEFAMLSSYINELGTDFRGCLPYLLSLRYSDYYIEKFCNKLKDLNLWDTTALLLVADHGSSFIYYPLHNHLTNGFDDESYHIPVIIRIPNGKTMQCEGYYGSQDVYPTLLAELGLKVPNEMTGQSMVTSDGAKYVITEYMGPGCPDITGRPIWFSIRDDNFVVAYKVGIYDTFEDGELSEVYRLNEDANCFYNINDRIKKHEIDYLLKLIKKRWEYLKDHTDKLLTQLEQC